MIEHIRAFLEMGFTPSAAIALVAVGVLWAEILRRDVRQRKEREAWHLDTRTQVDELKSENVSMQVHIIECNLDREKLKDSLSGQEKKVAVLEERMKRLDHCPRKDCPMRLPQ